MMYLLRLVNRIVLGVRVAYDWKLVLHAQVTTARPKASFYPVYRCRPYVVLRFADTFSRSVSPL